MSSTFSGTGRSDRRTHNMKQGDTRPPCRAALLDGNHDPLELAEAANVRFRMAHKSEDVTVEGDAAVPEETVEDGIAEYRWNDGDTDVIGRYEAEFIVEYDEAGEDRVHVPNDGNIEVNIRRNTTDGNT